MMKIIKRLIIMFLCGFTAICTNVVSTKAITQERFSIDNYEYCIYQINDKRFVEVYDIDNDTSHMIVYDNSNQQLTVDGEKQYFNIMIETPSLLDTSNILPYSTYNRYGPYNVTFEAAFKTIGLLAGTILAITSVATMVALVGVTTSAFSVAIREIYNYFSTINDVSDFVGSLVTGSFTYYQDIHNTTGQARYANRSVKYKFPTTSYKSYSFGNGGWFDTTRPGY